MTRLDDVSATTIKGLGFDYVGCERVPVGRRSLLRIYIEHINGTLTVDDCAKVSRQLKAVLLVDGIMTEDDMLEVSSPGLERRLFTLEHYQRFIGQQIRLRLAQPLNGQRNFTGVLYSADQQDVVVATGQEKISIPFVAIEKANLVADYKFK